MTTPQASAPALPLPGNASAAVTGMMWVATSNVLVRALAFAGQIVVGWLLLPEDFGVWALAVSISTAVQSIRNGGTSQILIKRGTEYAAQVGLVYRYSLAFNFVAMALLASIAMFLAGSRPSLSVVLLGVAASIPIGTPAMLLKARLSIERRFRDLAGISLGAAFVWQITVVTGALAGWGAMSFALAPLLTSAYESLASWRCIKSLPSLRTDAGGADYWALFRESRWVMLSAAALGLATSGDYFAVGLLTDVRTAGIYFFAFQLVVAASAPIYGAMEVVLPPLLIRFNDDRQRQAEACSRAIRAIIAGGVPAAAAVALSAPLAMHLVWRGAWDMAAPVVQTLAVCIPAWLLVSAARSLIEARGLWRVRFFVLGLYGVGGMGSAAVGTLFGSVEAIATCVTVFYASYAIVVVLMLKKLGVPALHTIRSLWVPLALTAVAILVGSTAAGAVAPERAPWLHDSVRFATFLVVIVLGNFLFLRETWQEIFSLVLKRAGRKAA